MTNMKQYIKDGITKPQNRIVLHTTEIVEDELGRHTEKKMQVINPSHDMLIEHGWVEYIEPSEEEVAKQREVSRLRRSLSTTDYKVIKCMEAYLCGEELPYDINALHIERNAQRLQINTLENQ